MMVTEVKDVPLGHYYSPLIAGASARSHLLSKSGWAAPARHLLEEWMWKVLETIWLKAESHLPYRRDTFEWNIRGMQAATFRVLTSFLRCISHSSTSSRWKIC